jgi:hypothetical protein
MARKTVSDTTPLDVWLAFESPDDEDASHEANIFHHGERFRIEWYNNAVGLVSYLYYDTYAEAAAKLTADGYQDFSS